MPDDLYEKTVAEIHNFRGQVYWEYMILVEIIVEEATSNAIFMENYSVKIDLYSGACLEIANSSK